MSRVTAPFTRLLLAGLLAFASAPAAWAEAIIGEALFADKKCMTCHKVAGEGGSIGPDLTSIGSADKGRDWHMRHLMDPKSVVPYSIMPAFAGSKTEAAHLVDYLISLTGDLLAPQTNTQAPASLATATSVEEAAAMARNSVAAVPAPIPPKPIFAAPLMVAPAPEPPPVIEPEPEIAIVFPVIQALAPEEAFEEDAEISSESRVTRFFPTGPEEDLAVADEAITERAAPVKKAPPVKVAAPRTPAPVKKLPVKLTPDNPSTAAAPAAKPATATPSAKKAPVAAIVPSANLATRSDPAVVAAVNPAVNPASEPQLASGSGASGGTTPVVVAPVDTRTGKALFTKKGCTSCHQIDGLGGTFGPNLSREGTAGRTRDWHIRHLLNPSSVVAGSPMPTLVTDPVEAGALADYLMSLGVGDAATAAEIAVPEGMSPALAHRYAALASTLDDLQGRVSHAAERGRNVDDLNVMLSQGRTHVGTLEQMVADQNVTKADGEVEAAEVVIDELTAALDQFEHQLDERVWLAVGVLLMTLLGCLLLLKKIRLLTLEWQAEQADTGQTPPRANPAPALAARHPASAAATPVPDRKPLPPPAPPSRTAPARLSGPSFLGSRSAPPVPPPPVPHQPKPKPRPKPDATPPEPAVEPETDKFPRMKSGVGISPNTPDGPVVKRPKKPPAAKKKGMTNAPRSGRGGKADPIIVEDDIASDPGGPPKRKPPGSSS